MSFIPSLPSFGSALGQQAMLRREQLSAQIFNDAFSAFSDSSAGRLNDLFSRNLGIYQELVADSLFGKSIDKSPKIKGYSNHEFKELTDKPVIKDILPGSHKATREEAKKRIQEHLDLVCV